MNANDATTTADVKPDTTPDTTPTEVTLDEVGKLKADIDSLTAEVRQFLSDAKGGKVFAAYEDFARLQSDTAQGFTDVKAVANNARELATDNGSTLSTLRQDLTSIENDVSSLLNDVKHGKLFSLPGDVNRLKTDAQTDLLQAGELEARLLGR